MGPIHTRAGRDELADQLQDGVAKGGELLVGGGTGGHDRGWFLEPAVVANPGEDSRLVREEVFGPVLPVFPYTDFDDALRRANDTSYGLNASVCGGDLKKATAVASRIEAGNVNVNDILATAYAAKGSPSGGVKQSGVGARHGDQGLLKYTDSQTVAVRSALAAKLQDPGTDHARYARRFTALLRAAKHLPR